MIRPIDANALIAEYDRIHVGPPGKARKLIEDAPTIEPERTGKWIPCSERFPEEGKDVLAAVYFEGVKGFKPCHYVDIASRIDNEWSSDSDEHKIARDKHHIIAWMPLPEPYVEG